MTTYDVLAAVIRRWYVFALCVVLAAGVAYGLKGRPGVYMIDVEVYLIAPPDPTAVGGGQSNIGDSANSLISLAGLVERTVNADVEYEEPVSPDVTIVGLGFRSGTLVTLPNAGGQWNYSFTRPVLKVQSAGSSPEEVERLFAAALTEIHDTLDRLQDEDNIPPDSRVTTRLVPEQPAVAYLTGYPTRAAAMAVILGGALSVLACVLVDRLLARVRRRPPSRQQELEGVTV